MDQQPSEVAERLGAFSTWLARERELRGLSREAVVRATRLAPTVVDALEGGESSRLPPRAYVVGYLRAYAAAVGLDPDDVVLRYEEAAGEEGEGARRRRRGVALPLVAILVIVAIAGAAAWIWLR